MQGLEYRDPYTNLRRSRIRLTEAFALFALSIMLVSGTLIYLLHGLLGTNLDFWLFLVVFWLFYTAYILVRYALGGRWILANVERLSSPHHENRLTNALESVLLASGFTRKIRLHVIPDPDINAFSLSLPDGSYAIVSTQGLADKLSSREREAVIAHEIAHIVAGDTLIHTIMIRMCGKRALKNMRKGGFRTSLTAQRLAGVLIISFTIVAGFLVFLASGGSDPDIGLELPGLDLWLLAAALFIIIAASLPFLMHKCLKLVLGKEREYHADLQSAHFTRDPGAIYNAIEYALSDVGELLLLSSYLDPLLFHPVVDYSSYKPFQTQPTMIQRMRRLEAAFPLLETAR